MTTLGPSNLTLELPAATPDFTARVDSGLGLLVECRITGSRDFHENTLLKTLSSIIKINQNLCSCEMQAIVNAVNASSIFHEQSRSGLKTVSAWIEISAFVLYPLLTMLLIAEESIPLKGFASSFVLLRNYLIFFHSKSLQSYQGGNCWSL